MAESEFEVAHVAQLARLQLSAAEEALFQEQLTRILQYADELKKVDVSGVEAAAHSIPVFDVFREDEARSWFTAEEALSNAPRQANGLFVLTRVVE